MDVLHYWRTIIRSGVIGVWVGILPGVGEDMAAWSSYAAAKRLSKEPEKYGKGSIEGPDGGRDRRQRLGAGRHHPGAGAGDPRLGALRRAARRHDHPRRAGRADADGREPAVRLRRRGDGAVLHPRHPVLRPVLHPAAAQDRADPALDHDADHLRAVRDRLLFARRRGCSTSTPCSASARSIFVMRRYGYPAAPFVLGLVLGDILDKNLRRGLVLSDGDLLPFFTRPLSAILALLVLWTFVTNVPTINDAMVRAARRLARPRPVPRCAAGAEPHMRISLCNEVIAELPFERQCALAAQLGYDGIEIAPFTLAEDPTRLTAAQKAALRRAARDAGIAITEPALPACARPRDFRSPRPTRRCARRTIEVMRALCALAAELGARVLVHGSPDQRVLDAWRRSEGPQARRRLLCRRRGQAATDARVDLLHRAAVAPARPRSSTRSRKRPRSCAPSAAPALRTMIDCSAAGQVEAEPVPDLIRRWLPTGLIAHIHFNDPNRRGPGEGDAQVRADPPRPARRRLSGRRRDRAVRSTMPDGPTCAARAIGYIRGIAEGAAMTDAPRLHSLNATFHRAAGDAAPAVPLRRRHA